MSRPVSNTGSDGLGTALTSYSEQPNNKTKGMSFETDGIPRYFLGRSLYYVFEMYFTGVFSLFSLSYAKQKERKKERQEYVIF